jgi:glycosyltransferase involved in cell wall biosynthesis
MRVGVDGGCWSNRRGYGRFLREILDALARVDRKNEYIVFLDPPSFRTFHLRERFQPVLVELDEPVTQAASAEGRRSVRDLLRMGRAVARQRLDLLFFPSVYSYFPVLRRLPVLVCIHDTIPERDPKLHFQSWRQSLFWRAKVRLALMQATLVLTVSEYSKRCLGEILGVPAGKVRVIYEGTSAKLVRIDAGAAEHPYVLYVGGFSPHKNLPTLVRAFSRLRARSRGLRLILAGDYHADSFKGAAGELQTLVSDLGLSNEVVFTGFVPDEELCRLYNGASVVALPSLDEGFGLPALEAMTCGIPVVAGSGNALEEVVGDAGVLVQPHDEPALAAAIDRIVEDGAYAQELSRRALARAARFSWDGAAAELMRIFQETAEYRRSTG